MLFLINLIMCVITVTVAGPINNTGTIPSPVNDTLKPTRRILKGHRVGDTRPYMVYLRAVETPGNKLVNNDWVCGGVIIHEKYVLTSAACIEDAKHFYVISGTNKWIPYSEKENECISNGAMKAIWKCVPKSYVYDGEEFDNIRWMAGDIAVVKVEDAFNFEKRVRGCDFVPKKVDFNNRSADLEKPRSFGSIAGWGTDDAFDDILKDDEENIEKKLQDDEEITEKATLKDDEENTEKAILQDDEENKEKVGTRTVKNSPELMESDVQLISVKNCKQRWDSRYHYIIDEQMVCTKDIADDESMSSLCADRDVNCKELEYSDNDNADGYDDNEENKNEHVDEEGEYDHDVRRTRRMMVEPGQLQVHTAGHYHDHDTRRKNAIPTGGFCENDHGGPLIVGQGKTAVVIGVMSACLTKDVTRKCYGPFLYTSVYRYRNLISCAIEKENGATCRMLLRSSKTPMVETFFDWTGLHPSLHSPGSVKTKQHEKSVRKSPEQNELSTTADASKNVSSTTKKRP